MNVEPAFCCCTFHCVSCLLAGFVVTYLKKAGTTSRIYFSLYIYLSSAVVFSSPEPKAPGELMDGKGPSSVRRPSVHNFKRLLL